MLKDQFGVYEVTFYYNEPSNKKNYEFRKYVNSKKIKELGGMYAIYCEEDSCIIFRKTELLRDNNYPRFILGTAKNIINTENIKNTENVNGKKVNYYSLPSKIDTSKLTEEEFKTLIKLIKKGLVTD